MLGESVRPGTRTAYQKGVREFCAWVAGEQGAGGPPEWATPREVDVALSDFLVARRWEDDSRGARQRAVNAVSGVQLYLGFKAAELNLVHRLLRAWDKIRPGQRRPPLTRGLAYALAREVRRFGQPEWAVPVGGPRRGRAAATAAAAAAAARTEPLRVSCLLVLTFAGFLRISELCALRLEDVALPGDARLFAGARGQAAGLRVRWAKTGAEQFVSVEEATALAALRWLAAHTVPGGLLVAGLEPGDLRAVLAAALRRLGLAEEGYVPHSLRHGAATDAFACGVEVRTIAARGRWESEESLRRYVQAGRALALAARLPTVAQAEVAAVELGGTAAVLGPALV